MSPFIILNREFTQDVSVEEGQRKVGGVHLVRLQIWAQEQSYSDNFQKSTFETEKLLPFEKS